MGLTAMLVALLLPPLASANLDFSSQLTSGNGIGIAGYAVSGAGNLCTVGSAGERKIGTGQPMPYNASTRYHHGSNTKSMTSTLLAILIHTGEVSGGWDATLSTLLPTLAGSSAYAAVTLKQPVGMLSGIAANPPSWSTYHNLQGTIRSKREAAAPRWRDVALRQADGLHKEMSEGPDARLDRSESDLIELLLSAVLSSRKA